MAVLCTDVTQSFANPATVRQYMEEARDTIQYESDRIFYNDAQSWWINFVMKEAFPLHKGYTQQIKEREPSFVPPDLPWKDVTTLVNEGKACTISPYEIRFGANFREVKLETLEIRGPDICFIELLDLHAFEEELRFQYEELAAARQIIYENRYRDAYIRMASRKYLMASGMPYTGPGDTFPDPTGLTVGKAHESLLRKIAGIFNNTGGRRAGQNMGMSGGAPVYLAVGRQEVFDDILRNDAESRLDLRDSSQVDELLKTFHIGYTYRQFAFIDDTEAPRFDFIGGTWIRRNYWMETDATIGVIKKENPYYETAQYDVITFIANRKGPRSQKLPQQIATGGNTNFGPAHTDFSLDFKNYGDNHRNIMRHMGFFLGNAFEAIDPGQERWVIVVLVARDTGGITIVEANQVAPATAVEAPIMPAPFYNSCAILAPTSCCNTADFVCASAAAPGAYDNGIQLSPMVTGEGIIEVGGTYTLLGAGDTIFEVSAITGDDDEIVTFGYDGDAIACADLIQAWQATPVIVSSSSSSSEEASSSGV